MPAIYHKGCGLSSSLVCPQSRSDILEGYRDLAPMPDHKGVSGYGHLLRILSLLAAQMRRLCSIGQSHDRYGVLCLRLGLFLYRLDRYSYSQSRRNLGHYPFDGKEQLREIVQRVIEVFEPRFKTVRVSLIGNADASDRTLRLKIDAMLHAEPAPEVAATRSACQ